MNTEGPLPEQTLKGSMCEVRTPCELHSIYYPQALVLMAIAHKRYAVFETICECETAYIYACQDDGCHVRRLGNPEAIAKYYEAIPWREYAFLDENGKFNYKVAPSLERLKEYLAK